MSEKGKPFNPVLSLKDDLDKPNASNQPKSEEWHKSIVPSLFVYTGTLVFFVLLTIIWIATHSNALVSQVEMTNNYIVTALLLGIDGILLYGLFHGMEFMKNKARRETLINLSEHQATIQHFTDQLNQMMRMQDRFMTVLEERAKKSYYQGVLSVADSHDNADTETDARTYHAPPDDVDTSQFGLQDSHKEKEI